jgi:hypothetical protein
VSINLKNPRHLLLVIAIICLAVGWASAAGHTLFGNDTEWLFAGLIAFTAAHLPNS